LLTATQSTKADSSRSGGAPGGARASGEQSAPNQNQRVTLEKTERPNMKMTLIVAALFAVAMWFGTCAGHWMNDKVAPRYVGVEETQ
jgi:hypothetical protein